MSASGLSCAAAAAQLCRRRSSRQLGAGVDVPHTEREISKRPFSTCRTCWSTPESTLATLTRVAGCRWTASRPAQPTLPTSTSMSSELGWARCTTMERFMMLKLHHQPAAALIPVLDQLLFRQMCGTHRRCPASSRRAAAAAKRPARRPHATRSSNEARTAVTASASNVASGLCQRRRAVLGSFTTSPLARAP